MGCKLWHSNNAMQQKMCSVLYFPLTWLKDNGPMDRPFRHQMCMHITGQGCAIHHIRRAVRGMARTSQVPPTPPLLQAFAAAWQYKIKPSCIYSTLNMPFAMHLPKCFAPSCTSPGFSCSRRRLWGPTGKPKDLPSSISKLSHTHFKKKNSDKIFCNICSFAIFNDPISRSNFDNNDNSDCTNDININIIYTVERETMKWKMVLVKKKKAKKIKTSYAVKLANWVSFRAQIGIMHCGLKLMNFSFMDTKFHGCLRKHGLANQISWFSVCR